MRTRFRAPATSPFPVRPAPPATPPGVRSASVASSDGPSRRLAGALLCLLVLTAGLSCRGRDRGREEGPEEAGAPRARIAMPLETDAPPGADETMEPLAGLKLSDDEGYASHPAVATGPDGVVWTAWVRTRTGADGSMADEVVVRSARPTNPQYRVPESLSSPAIVSSSPGQYLHPSLAVTGAGVWCFWTASAPGAPASILYARFSRGAWTRAERLLPGEDASHMNAATAVSRDGSIAVICQIHDGHRYGLAMRMLERDVWQEPRVLFETGAYGASEGARPSPAAGSEDDGAADRVGRADRSAGPESVPDEWDPVAVFGRRGDLHIAWSAFLDGDYDIWYTTIPAKADRPDPPRRLSARGEIDLHPSLALDPRGRIWLSWDVVRVSGMNGSGNTTITGANRRAAATGEGDEEGASAVEDEATFVPDPESGIDVRVIADGDVLIPGRPREEIVAPTGYSIAHRAAARIAIGRRGEPWIVYRALLRQRLPWSPAPRDGYLWEVIARPFLDGRWGSPFILLESDGYLEEAGVTASQAGVRVVFSGEHRLSTARRVSWPVAEADIGAPATGRRLDFDGFSAWKGDVYLATLVALTGAPPEALPPAPPPADLPVTALPSRDVTRDDVVTPSGVMHLYRGDLHRHSNVSRCTRGSEPTPEDRYRYGTDFQLYDFLALTDHTEYTTDWYWWQQQKLADAYEVPGFLTVFYGYEWSLLHPDGHHNAIFPSRPVPKMHGWLGETASLEGGWRMLRRIGAPALTIPHTPAQSATGTAWDTDDPEYQRLCEVFQAYRGSYECDGCPRQYLPALNVDGLYQRALDKGFHLGAIASSDHGYGVSYACVYAGENTRDAVFAALRDRRTFGSSTYGLALDVRSGAHWMGEEWSSAEAPRLEIHVRSDEPIRSVEIIGRSRILHSEGSVEAPLDRSEVGLSWSDPDWKRQRKEQYYYVRVTRADDEMAWSSPVWVTPAR